MVTFAQEAPGVQPVGIGNQQIINRDTSGSGALVGVANQVARGIDKFGDVSAKSTASTLVPDAQARVQREQLESDELGVLSGMTDLNEAEIARKTALLDRGVKAGRLTRENARLRVANLVTQAIEEQPMFQDKIRKAASSLLGFNPEAEGVRQFFGSFQPQGQVRKDPNLVQAEFMASQNFGTVETNLKTIAQSQSLALQKKIATDQLVLGNLSADKYFTQTTVADTIKSQNTIMSTVKQLADDGQVVDENVWGQTINAERDSSWNAFFTVLKANNKVPNDETLTRLRASHDARYERIFESVKKFDSSFLTKQNLERLQVAQQAFAAEAFPVMTFLTNAYGDRLAGQFLDMIKDANGNQKQLEEIFGSSGGFGDIAKVLTDNPKEFTDRFRHILETLPDLSQPIEAKDSGYVDLIVKAALAAPPEEREKVFNSLQDRGKTNKTSSAIGQLPATGTTPNEKKFMKDNWSVVQTVSPITISDIITDTNTGGETGDVHVIASNGNLVIVAQRRPSAFSPIDTQRVPTQLPKHPANDEVQKINLYLNAVKGRGWGSTLDVKSAELEALRLANDINDRIQGVGAVKTVAQVVAGMSKEEQATKLTELQTKRARVRGQ